MLVPRNDIGAQEFDDAEDFRAHGDRRHHDSTQAGGDRNRGADKACVIREVRYPDQFAILEHLARHSGLLRSFEGLRTRPKSGVLSLIVAGPDAAGADLGRSLLRRVEKVRKNEFSVSPRDIKHALRGVLGRERFVCGNGDYLLKLQQVDMITQPILGFLAPLPQFEFPQGPAYCHAHLPGAVELDVIGRSKFHGPNCGLLVCGPGKNDDRRLRRLFPDHLEHCGKSEWVSFLPGHQQIWRLRSQAGFERRDALDRFKGGLETCPGQDIEDRLLVHRIPPRNHNAQAPDGLMCASLATAWYFL